MVAHNYSQRITSAMVAFLTLAVLGIGHGFAPSPLAAQDDETTARVETLSAEGAGHYKAKEYKKAIAKFEQALKLAPVPTLLYNIALCYEKLDDTEHAIAALKKFMVAEDADPEIRAKALERIDKLEKKRNAAAAEALGDPPDGDGGDDTAKVSPPDDGGQGPTVTEHDGFGTLGVTGIILGAGGVAVAVTGLVFGIMANSDAADFDQERDPLIKGQLKDDAQSKAMLADILYGTGAAAAITGLVLMLVDNPSPAKSPGPAAQVVPWVGGEHVGAAVVVPLGPNGLIF